MYWLVSEDHAFNARSKQHNAAQVCTGSTQENSTQTECSQKKQYKKSNHTDTTSCNVLEKDTDNRGSENGKDSSNGDGALSIF